MKKTMNILLTLVASFVLATPVFAEPSSWQPAGNNIRTRWAAEVNPDNARTEYPRPQMVRQNWVCLNGLWEYAITPICEQNAMPAPDGEILVPYCVESSLSGVGKRVGGDNLLWYRRTVALPEEWNGSKVLLHFDAVDWKADIFINGEFVTEHTGGYTAFTIDATPYFQNGTAEIVLKVWDPTDDTQYCIPRGKQINNPESIWYTPVTGIWQSVWMEPVPESYIKDYNVTADLAGNLTFDVDVEGAADQVKVEVLRPREGYDPEKPACGFFKKAKAKVAAGQSASLNVRRPKLWSPDSPYLYPVRIKLYKDGKVVDKVEAYTAIRTITEKKDEAGVKRLALNDEILFQFGPLDQGWWPDGLYTAPTAEAMAFDVEMTKELGFNMIRKHIKVEPARWYYDCDRLGMMVWQDMPCIAAHLDGNWGQGDDFYGSGKDYPVTDAQKENYYKEWTEILGQRKKFQSIVSWIPFNEAWGQFDTKEVVAYTRSIDPTRLINAASGGNWIEGAGEILDSHHYSNPKMRILDSAMVNVLGEYGGIGRPIEDHVWEIDRKWGYVQYDSEEKVTDAYVMYTDELVYLKQLDWCAAAVYTQTTDVEGEVNGFFTYDREVLKVDLDRVSKANRKVIEAANTTTLPLARPSAFHYKDPEAGIKSHLNLYTLSKGDITLQVTNFGARVISLIAPDKNGNFDDIVVGYNDAQSFVHNSGERYLGATVGPVANRIGKGTFTINGKTYHTPLNNNGQTLHGGTLGLDMVVWRVGERTDSTVTFLYSAPDGQDGFPGNREFKLTYKLTADNALDISYVATTDKDTPVNLSNHAFFNLKGYEGGTILDHNIMIDADGITPVDKYLIPTGEIMPVEGTPFDFREAHAIGERVAAENEQLAFGGGYDHNWVLNAPSDGQLHVACVLSEESTGRVLEISTDQPGIQFYCGNFFDGSYCGKNGKPIGYREALALETQKWPDAVNHPNFTNTVLHPGETYTQHSVYKFSVK